MINASDIVKEAYRHLGRPSQADLPYQDVLDEAKDVIRGRMADLKLSAKSHTNTIGQWATPTDREMSALAFTNGYTNIIPVKLEWRNAGDDSMPREAQIVSYESLTSLYRTALSDTYVAFYNGFSSIAFSELADTLSSREYRLIFETMDDVSLSSINATADLPGIFTALCAYETAANCLDKVENASEGWADKRERLRMPIMTNLAVWSDRFNKWQSTRYGSKKVIKQGFRPRFR